MTTDSFCASCIVTEIKAVLGYGYDISVRIFCIISAYIVILCKTKKIIVRILPIASVLQDVEYDNCYFL